MPAPAALITGGTSGIGKATAQLLHQRGYRVAVTGQNPDSITAALKELPEDVVVLRADARSLADGDRLAAEIGERFGALDLVFLNAGVIRILPIEAVDEAAFDELVNVNFKGQFFTLQKTLPLLHDGGCVLFTVGIGATRGVLGGSVAAASRGALLAMLPSLALELAPRGIRVNAISPGSVATGMWDKLGITVEEAEKATASRIPLGRFATSAEVAELAAFLASPAAAYITGENILIGGGSGLSQ
jgi:NAD(P)-dependent dehydrogenase (short-subunit alcohol dehydrogenase family)